MVLPVVLLVVVPVLRYRYLEVPVPVPVQRTRQYWYQYWYTEGTSFGTVFPYKYVWPKNTLLATHAGWLGTNRPHFWVVFLATRAAQSGYITKITVLGSYYCVLNLVLRF